MAMSETSETVFILFIFNVLAGRRIHGVSCHVGEAQQKIFLTVRSRTHRLISIR